MTPAVIFGWSEAPHCVVERQAEALDVEADVIAGLTPADSDEIGH
jgi:hypothetical protein